MKKLKFEKSVVKHLTSSPELPVEYTDQVVGGQQQTDVCPTLATCDGSCTVTVTCAPCSCPGPGTLTVVACPASLPFCEEN